MACALHPFRARLASADGRRGRTFGLQSGDGRGSGENLNRHRRRNRIPAHFKLGGARIGPRRDAIPTWYLLAVWVVAAGAAALGYLTNDLAAPGLVGGLVLIVMLIGFTVMQFAFSGSSGAMDSGPDAERRSLAMTGSGEAIFDWNVLTDEVNGSEVIESQLGLKRGALEGPAAGWLDVLHPLDRDRYTLALDGLLHQRSGRINHDLSLRGSDGHYFWYRSESEAGHQRRRRGGARDRLAVGRDGTQIGRGAHAP